MVLSNASTPLLPTHAQLWIARDTAQSGLYTLWAYNHPSLNAEGFWKADVKVCPLSVLLMSIHASRWPWDELKLDRGEVVQLDMHINSVDRTHKVSEEVV